MDAERADFIQDEHLEYLDNLRESGATNMFGAPPYLQEVYPELTIKQARTVLSFWMHTFSERHAND